MTMTTEADGRRLVLLLGGGPDLVPAVCWRCKGQAWPSSFFVGEPLDGDGHAGVLCSACAGAAVPALAAAAEGLNLIDAAVSGLGPEHRAALARALTDLAAFLDPEAHE